MDEHSGTTRSIWMQSEQMPSFGAIKSDWHSDVCIVGAGIAGLTTAYLLLRAGKTITIVDDGPVVSGESERTTAHLSNALDDRYFEIEKVHGPDGARLAAESHTAAIDQIEIIVREERIRCDFERVDGYLFVPDGDPIDILEAEYNAARRAGLQNVQLCEDAPLPTISSNPVLRFPNQAQFHPTNYCRGLIQAITREGGTIFTNTHASSIVGGSGARVKTSNGPTIRAKAIVVATNSPVNDQYVIHTKQAAYRTYVICLKIPSGSVPRALYWDTLDPYHYVRLQSFNGTEYLIVGGEDHRSGQATNFEERYENLEAWARFHFPMAGEVTAKWSGHIMEPVDYLAYIGRNPLDEENVFIATGDSGNGVTHGTIAGILLRDLILNIPNEWAHLYDPSRKTVRSIKEYLGENLNTAAQYGDWLTGSDSHLHQPGKGLVMRSGLSKIAVLPSLSEEQQLSAVCPHLKGIVHWNDLEKSWDCPCHGSRFDKQGTVINGPANSNLRPETKKKRANE